MGDFGYVHTARQCVIRRFGSQILRNFQKGDVLTDRARTVGGVDEAKVALHAILHERKAIATLQEFDVDGKANL